MSFTDKEKIEEFTRLRDVLDSIEIASEVLPKGELSEETTLLVCLPSAEKLPEEDEVKPEDLHMAAGYLIDLDDAEQKLAKYLLFYSQIPVDLSAMKVESVLLMINELNRKVRVGHYFLSQLEENGPYMVQYRATVSGMCDLPFDEGVVADTILEMGIAYDVAREAFTMANEECKNRG